MTQTIKDQINALETALKNARAHLKLLKALDSGVFKIVPVDPTENMWVSASIEYSSFKHDTDDKTVWKSTIKEAIKDAPEYSFDE